MPERHRRSADPALASNGTTQVSVSLALVEGRDECRSAAVDLAQPSDVGGEGVRLARGVRRDVGLLEDLYGAPIGAAIGLDEDLVDHARVDRECFDWVAQLAPVGQTQQQILADLVGAGSAGGFPGKLIVAIVQEHRDEGPPI
jgi:hypothetical protein